MSFLKSIFLLFILLSLLSCRTNQRPVAMPMLSDLDSIQKGMTTLQVKQILGFPSWQGTDKHTGKFYFAYYTSDTIIIESTKSYLVIFDSDMRVEKKAIQDSKSGGVLPVPFFTVKTTEVD